MLVSVNTHRRLLLVSVFVTAVCLEAASHLKLKVPRPWEILCIIGIASASIFLSSSAPSWISWLLSKSRWYRRLFLGETWVEGAWLFESRHALGPNETDTKRIRIGVVAHSYHGEYLSLRTEGHHLEFTDVSGQTIDPANSRLVRVDGRLWLESEPILAQSKMAFMDSSLTYINFFKYDGESSGEGTASGWFKTGDGRRWPEEFTATIVTDRRDILYQRGRKLDDHLVRTLASIYGSEWEEVLIRHRFLNGNSWRTKLHLILPNHTVLSHTASNSVASESSESGTRQLADPMSGI
jgi:hypothetical protein